MPYVAESHEYFGRGASRAAVVTASTAKMLLFWRVASRVGGFS